jgi:hypothetical protein
MNLVVFENWQDMSESRRFPWKRVAGNVVARQSKIGKTCLNLVVFLRKELPEILLLGNRKLARHV